MSILVQPPLRLNQNKPLFILSAANMNITTDQSFVKQGTFTQYVIDRIIAVNASTSLSVAAGGIYTAASKAGTAIVAAAQVFSGLTGSTKVLPLTLAVTDLRTETPILSLTLAQGGAATADFYIMGYALS